MLWGVCVTFPLHAWVVFLISRPHIPPFCRITSEVITASQRNGFTYGWAHSSPSFRLQFLFGAANSYTYSSIIRALNIFDSNKENARPPSRKMCEGGPKAFSLFEPNIYIRIKNRFRHQQCQDWVNFCIKSYKVIVSFLDAFGRLGYFRNVITPFWCPI